MKVFGWRLAFSGALAAIISCSGPTEPSGADEDLRFSVAVSPTPIVPGQIVTITFTLQNAGDETVNLSFNSGCQILPYILVRSTNVVVYPSGGEWACTLVFTQVSLRPGASLQKMVRVRTPDAPGDADTSLPRGEYLAFARLEDIRVRLQSDPVSFVIQ